MSGVNPFLCVALPVGSPRLFFGKDRCNGALVTNNLAATFEIQDYCYHQRRVRCGSKLKAYHEADEATS
jgi:hypothetical protein